MARRMKGVAARLGWFALYWSAGVLSLGIAAYGIRWAIG